MGPELAIIGIVLFGIFMALLASMADETDSSSEPVSDGLVPTEQPVEIHEGIDSIGHPFYQDVYSHRE